MHTTDAPKAPKRAPAGRVQLGRYIKAHPEIARGDLARKCGMTIQQLGHLVTGRRRATLRQAVSFEDRLSIPVRAWLRA